MLKYMKMADKLLIGLLLCVFLPVANGVYCYKKRYSDTDQKFYCSNGCCGSDYNRYCCVWDEDTLQGAAIAGIVVGCVILVAIVVGTIIAIYCCLRKQRSQQGQVIGGVGVTTATTTYPAASYPMNLQVPYGQPQGPPAYGQTGYSNAGFPANTTSTTVAPPMYTK